MLSLFFACCCRFCAAASAADSGPATHNGDDADGLGVLTTIKLRLTLAFQGTIVFAIEPEKPALQFQFRRKMESMASSRKFAARWRSCSRSLQGFRSLGEGGIDFLG